MQGSSSETTMQHRMDEVETDEGVPHIERQPVKVGRGPGGLLTVAGLGMAAAGGALAALPRFAPQFDWSVRNLASEGVSGGTFAVGGVLLIAMGMAARAQARFFRATSERSDADLMLEHLAGELADIRSEIRDTNQRVGYVRDETRGLFEAVQARENMDATDNETRDATFRLAASLDQLGARIEKRMQARDASIEQVFGDLRQQLGDVRSLAEELRGAIDRAPAAPAPQAAPVQGEPQVGMAPPPSPEAPAMAQTAAPQQQTVQGPPQGLDLLDHLEAEQKTSFRERPEEVQAYAPIAGPELGNAEPRAPLPAPVPQGVQQPPISLTMRPTEGALQPGDGRIEEIRALLSDERVREALQLQLDSTT